jgi:hypothetical protein
MNVPHRLFLLAPLLPFSGAYAAENPAPILRDQSSLLFIGNSYMGIYGGVNEVLQKMLAGAAAPLRITTQSDIYYGKPLTAMFTDKAQDLITSKKFDPVIITSGSLDVMKQFDALIRAQGSRTVVYMTWSGSHPGNKSTMENYHAVTAADAKTMRQMERETNAVIVPVGVVYYDLIRKPPRAGLREDYLWRKADIHQDFLGTAVNAWTLSAVLTGRSPVGLDFDYTANLPDWLVPKLEPDDLKLARDASLRRALQERVWQIVQQWKSGTTEFDQEPSR